MNCKKLLYLTILLLTNSYALQGQWSTEEPIVLTWTEKNIVDPQSGEPITIPSFEGALHQDPFRELPLFTAKVNSPISGTVTARVTNEVWEESEVGRPWYNEAKRGLSESEFTEQSGSHYINFATYPYKVENDKLWRLRSFTLKLHVQSTLSSDTRDPVFASNSVLRQGTFYKVAVQQTGAYRLTGQQMVDMGIQLSSINPSLLKVYSGHGGRLPGLVDADRTDDLVQTPIVVNDGGDGTFDAGDEILFFAYGPDVWTYEDGTFEFQKNVYSTNHYIFLQTDGGAGLRMQQAANPSGSPSYTSDTYDFLQRYEDDRTNLLGSYQSTEGTGQDWYGDYFGAESEKTLSQHFDFRGLVTAEPATVTYRAAARSRNSTSLSVYIDNERLQTNYSPVTLTSIESDYARNAILEQAVQLQANSTIRAEYEKRNTNDEAWLDYLQIKNRRQVGQYGMQTVVQDTRSIDAEVASFSMSGPTASQVWNITNAASVASVSTASNAWTYETKETVQRFLLIDEYLTAEPVGPVENQNLHAINEADMIVLSAPEFLAEANRLAEHRRSFSNLNVVVVTPEQVYNEFSSGKQDAVAVRDFMKMVHERTSNLKYLLMVGDATYDYRNLVPGLPNHNFAITYQTKESINPISGFPTDDYFGLLSNNEGEDLRGDLEISVGRLPVETAEQARVIIDKIIRYDTGSDRFGDWRLRLGFAADDEDNGTHVRQTDEIAEYVQTEYPDMNAQKVYFDAFEQVSTPGGDRFYQASEAINRNVQAGQLVLNYLGHGGPKGWAQERVLKFSDIDTWTNEEHLPILMTATCTFTGYDDPNVTSAGEYAIRKADGGCVALYTTVRAVFSQDNERLADEMFTKIFRLEDGRPQTLGDIILNAKNSFGSANTTENSRKFALIGDPSMRIALPTERVVTTAINGIAIGAANQDTAKALQKMTLEGIITDNAGTKLEDFNGTITATVFDKESTKETLQNDSSSPRRTFDVYTNILFKGGASVTNGEFKIEFVVPKDINYQFGEGRVSYYAHNGVNLDAAGHYSELIVGGSSDNIASDDEGPEIELFMNDRKFKNGGIVNPDGTLLVYLADDLGINVSGTSIGHDLTATLDGTTTYILNDFYRSELNDFTKGLATFPLNDLAPGIHTIEVRAWDVSNNSSRASITFEVVEGMDGLINAFAYPNPFVDQVTFVFEHDLLGQQADIEIDVYNAIGQYQQTVKYSAVLTGNRMEVPFAFVDKLLLDTLAKGMHFFKIKVTATELNISKESNFEKFVKI